MSEGPITVIVIETFEDLRNALYSFDAGHVFRGQRNASWALESTMERFLANATDYRALAPIVEGIVLDSLKSRLHHYVHRDAEPKSNLGWLAIAQHHGAPTRLLDFTQLPLVALYFATRGSQKSRDDFAVWVLNFRELNRDSERSLAVAPLTIDRDPDGYFEACEITAEEQIYSGVWVGEPRKVNLRLERQGGTFLVPMSSRDKLNQTLLKTTGRIQSRISKLVVSGSLRMEASEFLEKSGITASRLFEGVDGLAIEISEKLERVVSKFE